MKRFGLLALLLASGAVAFSQEETKPDGLFKKLDKNNDGKLVKDEVPEDQVRFFERLLRVGDADKNGELTAAEFAKASADEQPAPRPPEGRRADFDPKQMFERMDRNQDGKISRDEIPEFAKERFGKAFDELKKDAITFEEFVKLREQLGPPGGPNGRPMIGGDPVATFKNFDKNSDGKLKLDELPEQAQRFMAPMFERLGVGKDGSVTQEQFVKATEEFRRMRDGAPREGAPREGDRRPEGAPPAPREGDRKPEGGPPREGDRRPEGGPPREGDRRPEGGPPREGDRRPEGGPPREGDRRPEGGPPREGDRRPEGGPPREGGPRGLPRFFEVLDADHNGRVSREEFARMVKLFDEFDRNKDGSLDPAELLGPPPGGPDGDRPRPEGERPPQRGDAPRRPEGDRPKPEGAPREGDRPKPEGAQRGERTPEGGPPTGERLKELFSRMDKNNDGKLSKEEAPDRLKDNFEKSDTNKDGFVDKAELQKLFESGEGRPRRPE